MGLKDKASKIDFGSLPGVAVPAPAAEPTGLGVRPKTAPGLMMAQATDQRSELLRENEALKTRLGELGHAAARVAELQDELRAWDGAKATRLVDTRLISRSRWANRDERHFQTEEFQALKAEIASAGGNVQPIKVRPLPGGDSAAARYELVFGHRRYEACRQLGVPVLALVESLDDRGLFIEMDRENRARQDLSAWEQGVMYRRALQDGLFTSNRKLAEAVGADLTNVGRALALADLPADIVAAFATPMDLQFRWARPLSQAWQADPQALKARAAAIVATEPRPSAKDVFAQLVQADAQAGGKGGSTVLPPPQRIDVEVAGKRVATIAVDARGGARVGIEPGSMSAARLEDLTKFLERLLAPTKGRGRG